MRHTSFIAALAAVAATGTVVAQTAGPALPPEYRAYLPARSVSPAAHVHLPPPGSDADRRDRAIFKATRTLDGSPRWVLAQADAGRGILKAFSCAAGASLTDQNVPALVALLSRYRTDLINVTRTASGATAVPRPYQRDGGVVCLADKPLATASGTPAIQSAWGWTVGSILSEALPARVDALMLRGRAYGESAGVCGFASASEVAGGRDLAAAMLARARADATFSADLARATAQIAAAAGAGTAPEGCGIEEALVTRRPW